MRRGAIEYCVLALLRKREWYGFELVLPPTAQWPLHLGPAGYGNWVPRNVGLLMGPAIATVIFVILVVTGHGQQSDEASGLPTGLTIALALMLANQIGALRAALSRCSRNQP